ncbi:MAG: hypothetical protein K0Q55_3983, partial [Verrucomicrobia bacterium]|nr:hypothetical protein [Verrucomicrobiota bacterium]
DQEKVMRNGYGSLQYLPILRASPYCAAFVLIDP